MSEQLRHKMIEFEATPPPAAWETIAARLEDDNQYAALAMKMKNFETPAPAASWKVISARIEDDVQHAGLASKMNNFNVAPPADAWTNIAASLHQTTENEEKIAVIAPRRNMVYRMAAAAAVVIAIVGAWMFFNQKQTPDKTLVKTNPVVPGNPVVVPNNQPAKGKEEAEQDITVAIIPHQTDAREDRSAYVSSGNTASGNHELKYAVINNIPAYRTAPIVITSSPITDQNGQVIRDMDVLTSNSNYLLVMGPNGQTTRISSKFASVIRYLNGSNNSNDAEEYIDKVIKESDIWKKRFQEWRNKISQSSFIPSSANFLDIIEFKELIQEKQ